MLNNPPQLSRFDPRLSANIDDSFIGLMPTTSATPVRVSRDFSGMVNGVAAAVNSISDVANRCDGIVQLDHGTALSGIAMIGTSSQNIQGTFGLASLEWRVQLSALSGAVDRYIAHCGYIDTFDGVNANIFVFRYTDAESVNWQIATRTGGGALTFINTGIPMVAGQYYKLKMVRPSTGSSPPLNFASYYIDDIQVGQSSPIQIANSGMHILAAQMVKTVGTQSRQMNIDYCSFQHIFDQSL